MGAIESTAANRTVHRRRGCTSVPVGPAAAPDARRAALALANTTLVFMGNSIARHWAFLAAYILAGGTPFTTTRVSLSTAKHRPWGNLIASGIPSRDTQKLVCGSGAAPSLARDAAAAAAPSSAARDECHMEVGEHGTHVVFIHQQLVFGERLPETLRRLSARDVLVLGVGTHEAFCPRLLQGSTAAQAQPQSAAQKLAPHLHALSRRGTRVYWRTHTKLCGKAWFCPGDSVNTINARLANSSAQLLRAVCTPASASAAGGGAPPIRVLDAWEWTREASCGDYDDFIHHSRLSASHVASLMNDLVGTHRRV